MEGPVTKGAAAVFTSVGTIVLCGAIAFGMYGCPSYHVWQQTKEGEAELAKATQNRQIAVQEAQAKKESAVLLAEAEVLRAEGAAKANAILGQSLKDNEAYLWYLWLQSLDAVQDHGGTVVYVPTESGMPVMEAGRFLKHFAPPAKDK